ncbi:hypothetical protein SLEP1_g57306 [Rubroshorea leprosula]|uniref:Uncharacterized protein n=1 Tax=Rubroshorea leprosula TaxID=152421 RepID=A0AAV5MKU2_9ROSI|nr:hypothetical protein SLEP1_g57306 [Rubroshorea leprosula]
MFAELVPRHPGINKKRETPASSVARAGPSNKSGKSGRKKSLVSTSN